LALLGTLKIRSRDMKKYLYTVTYVNKNKYLKWIDIEVEHWTDIGTQINNNLNNDVDYIVGVRYEGIVSDHNKEN
jgi:hypothetical protein